MAYDVVVSPSARDDIENAVAYFEERNPGSVSQFVSRLERTVALVGAHPLWARRSLE